MDFLQTTYLTADYTQYYEEQEELRKVKMTKLPSSRETA